MFENWQEDPHLKIVMNSIGDRYEVLDYLGGGGFASTYLVLHKLLDKQMALKIMDVDYLLKTLNKGDMDSIEKKIDIIKDRFIREAQLYQKIIHRNIVKVTDIGLVNVEAKGKKIEIPYLIVEYIEGKTLKEVLIENSPLDIDTTFRIAGDILSSLGVMHNMGIIHRDMKSSNIMVEEESGRAVLIDFGLAKDLLTQTDLTPSGDSFHGTLSYMAPEQFGSLKSLTPAADVYSFGIVLYQMLTGEALFDGKNPLDLIHAHVHEPVPDVREKNPILPEGIEKVISKAMEKKPENRFRNAGEFLTALKDVEKKTYKERSEEEFQKPKTEKITSGIFTGNIFKYLLLAIIALSVAALIVLNPLGIGIRKVDSLYSEYIDVVKKHIATGDYIQAEEFLNKAKAIRNTDEVKQLSERIVSLYKPTLAIVVFITNSRKGFNKQDIIDAQVRRLFTLKPDYVGWVSFTKNNYRLNDFKNNGERNIYFSRINTYESTESTIGKIIKDIERKFSHINTADKKKLKPFEIWILMDEDTIPKDSKMKKMENIRFIDIHGIKKQIKHLISLKTEVQT